MFNQILICIVSGSGTTIVGDILILRIFAVELNLKEKPSSFSYYSIQKWILMLPEDLLKDLCSDCIDYLYMSPLSRSFF